MMASSYCLCYPSNAHFSCFPSALMTFGEWWLAAVLEENTSKYDLNKNGSLAQEKKKNHHLKFNKLQKRLYPWIINSDVFLKMRIIENRDFELIHGGFPDIFIIASPEDLSGFCHWGWLNLVSRCLFKLLPHSSEGC